MFSGKSGVIEREKLPRSERKLSTVYYISLTVLVKKLMLIVGLKTQ